METLRGKIITGVQQCEDQEVQYKAYVVDETETEMEILDQDQIEEWFQNGCLTTYWVDRDEFVRVDEELSVDLKKVLEEVREKLKE